MIIYGAGLAGLIAANMLRRFQPSVREAQPALPDNHGALLRFRSRAVQDAVGQPFKKVMVHKAVLYNDWLATTPNLRFSNMYSQKVTGEVMGRSIMNLDPGERYIAPDDFIATLAAGVDIKFGAPLKKGSQAFNTKADKVPCISTIPMPVLMDLVGWDKPEFKWLPIWSFRAKIIDPPTDVYQTIYYPGQEPWYRASITGDQLIVEYPMEVDISAGTVDARNVLEGFGLSSAEFLNTEVKYQHYGKLLPIDDQARREFILAMTDQYGIYSIGRFATWRQILMDDVVNDVRVVEQFITQRSNYSRHLASNR